MSRISLRTFGCSVHVKLILIKRSISIVKLMKIFTIRLYGFQPLFGTVVISELIFVQLFILCEALSLYRVWESAVMLSLVRFQLFNPRN